MQMFFRELYCIKKTKTITTDGKGGLGILLTNKASNAITLKVHSFI